MICCNAYKILEFIKRLAYDFKLGMSLIILFCFLVYPILEYDAVLCDSYTYGHSHQIEMVQKNFFLILLILDFIYVTRSKTTSLSRTCLV